VNLVALAGLLGSRESTCSVARLAAEHAPWVRDNAHPARRPIAPAWPPGRSALRALRIGWGIVALLATDVSTMAEAVPPVAAAAPAAEAPARPLSVHPPSDGAIQERIEDILSALGGMDVDVEVRSGIVRLAGSADSLAARDQASDLAGRVEGVVLVRNELHVASDVRGRLGPTWAKVKRHVARALGFIPVLAVALAVFIAFASLAWAAGRWEKPFGRLGLSELGVKVLRIALRAILLVTGIVVTLDLLGLVGLVGTVVGTLGLFGVILGIALRDVIANYLPGIMLGLNPPFSPGDYVQIGDHSGVVVRVTSRETILVEDDGQHLRIPNVRLIQESIVNFERHRERRLHFTFHLALSGDLLRVRRIARETLVSFPGILREPRPFMRVLTIEADKVQVAFYAWADQKAGVFPDLESRARQAVKEALLAADVPLPVPEIAVRRAASAESVEGDGPGGRDEAVLAAHVRAERAAPGERDLLREGRSRPS
jgi:small-conductance mechanosensitive channel